MTDWSQITKLGTSSLGGDVYSIHIKTAKGPVSKETAVKTRIPISWEMQTILLIKIG